MKYILRLLVQSNNGGYWTFEKPVEDVAIPSVHSTISIIYNKTIEGTQILFDVESVVHYPDRDIGPMVIARCQVAQEIDDAVIMIDLIKSAYPGITVRANDILKPKWYEIYKLINEFDANDAVVIRELVRSIMFSTNIEIAQRNEYFQNQLYVLVEELDKYQGSAIKGFCQWGKRVDLDKLQIAPELIQPIVINAVRFLYKAGIDTSLWPAKCLDFNKANFGLQDQ